MIVGRIVKVEQRKWKVDINSHLLAQLSLTSVNLPGGELRRRDELDELTMRKHLQENDLISAEVQKVYTNEGAGMCALHTRSLKYGKLGKGVLVVTSPSLIKARKNHFISLLFGVSMIIGNNGYIWLYGSNDQCTSDTKEKITRVRNCVLILQKYCIMIYDTSILLCFEYSQQYTSRQLLEPDIQQECAEITRQRLESTE